MAEYLSQTISQLIEDIEEQKLVLPAMQRNFVWPDEKIYSLFFSLQLLATMLIFTTLLLCEYFNK